MKTPYLPREMREPPRLSPTERARRIRPKLALLVNPFYPKDPRSSFGKHVLTPTTALSAIAAATPPDWEVRIVDENLLQGPPPTDPLPEVVGITVHLTFARRAYDLARSYRDRGAKVVLGGLHVTSCPDEAAPHADSIVTGNGIPVWPEVLRDVERGRLRKVYRGSFEDGFGEEPAPRRDLISRRDFLTTASVIATRGCVNRCDFCYLSTGRLRMPHRSRPVESVASEIERSGSGYIVFTDNNLGASRAYLSRLCRALRPLGIIWSAAVSLDVTDDPRLVREMALSGCTGVLVGFETLDAGNLAASGKRSPSPADYARRVRMLSDAGVQVNGSFVFGFDHDRPDVFDRTTSWIEENRLECATFHILTPYPGTPLFRRLSAERRILTRNWSRYDTAHAVFSPRHMSPRALEAGYARCYQRLFTHASIWCRRPEDPRAVLPYLAMSYLYKRSNRLWRLLIRHRLTGPVWGPLIGWTRRRHVRFRERLGESATSEPRTGAVVPAGV